MTFSKILKKLKKGCTVSRKYWEIEEKSLFTEINSSTQIIEIIIFKDGKSKVWKAKSEDLLADDWYIVSSYRVEINSEF